ncbi:MAG: ISKra4 family transposase [Limisphaerales bacterium]
MAQFQSRAPAGEAVAQLEMLVRTALFKSANVLVGWLLQQAAERIDALYQPKPGEVRKGREAVQVQGIFGSSPLGRDYYYHAGKKQGHYPADDALGLEVGYTLALAKLICLEGADEQTYLKAERHLEQTGGIPVSARQIQRVVQRVGSGAQAWQEREALPGPCDAPVLYVSGDGTGVPMAPEELKGRKGKQADGSAKTRQVYLGCVFTQHKTDEQGHPVRDYESTTYVSSFKPIDDFGPLLRREAIRRGLGSAGQVVLLIDGAAGLENMGKDCFKYCIQIVDFYHALEHAGLVLAALIGKNHPDYQKRLHRWAKRLLKDKVRNLIAQTRQECAGQPQSAEVEKALGYFVRNVQRMQYGTFRSQGYFIGSGVVEAGCKTIIGSRCKQSGMFWSQSGAQNVLALCCIHSSRRLDEFWKHRLNQQAARNDTLSLAA